MGLDGDGWVWVVFVTCRWAASSPWVLKRAVEHCVMGTLLLMQKFELSLRSRIPGTPIHPASCMLQVSVKRGGPWAPSWAAQVQLGVLHSGETLGRIHPIQLVGQLVGRKMYLWRFIWVLKALLKFLSARAFWFWLKREPGMSRACCSYLPSVIGLKCQF